MARRKLTLAAMLLVLAVNGWEASFWPRNNYPDALWHRKQPGDWTRAGIDICWPQERLPVTGPGAVGAYWFGESPYGFGGYYRPVTFTLYWLEYRLFGTDDQRWCHVSVGLYLAIQLLLVWLVSVLAPGTHARKLGLGVLAALLMGGPGLADRGIHYWVLGWWPAQPELLSLLFGLPLLGCVALYIRTGQRRWAYAAPILFFLSVCSKEMGYFGGIGACLLLLRRPQHRPLMGLIALEGLALFGFRHWVSGSGLLFGGGDFGLHRLWPHLADALRLSVTPLVFLPVHLGLLAGGVILCWPFRHRLGVKRQISLILSVWLGFGSLILGLPWQSPFRDVPALGVTLVWSILLLWGLWHARRRPFVLEMAGLYVLCFLFGMEWPLWKAWYLFWGSAFGAVITVLALDAIVDYGGSRLHSRRFLRLPHYPEFDRHGTMAETTSVA